MERASTEAGQNKRERRRRSSANRRKKRKAQARGQTVRPSSIQQDERHTQQIQHDESEARQHARANITSHFDRDKYTVGWICALAEELAPALASLDEIHENIDVGQPRTDTNTYILGRIGKHNIVLACLPATQYGLINTAQVGTHMLRTFPSIYVWLLVGIGGGVPDKTDLRLGDVVVGTRVIQYDLGKAETGGQIRRTGTPQSPDRAIMTVLSTLQANRERSRRKMCRFLSQLQDCPGQMVSYARPARRFDKLFEHDYEHQPSSDEGCSHCDQSRLRQRPQRQDELPDIHYGVVGSANRVNRDGVARKALSDEYGIDCLEMEAAGLIGLVGSSSFLVIRGLSDYSDSHKNDMWKSYAAATAACYAKEFLTVMPHKEQSSGRQTQSRADTSRLKVKGLKSGKRAKYVITSEKRVMDIRDVDCGDDSMCYIGDANAELLRAVVNSSHSRQRSTAEQAVSSGYGTRTR